MAANRRSPLGLLLFLFALTVCPSALVEARDSAHGPPLRGVSAVAKADVSEDTAENAEVLEAGDEDDADGESESDVDDLVGGDVGEAAFAQQQAEQLEELSPRSDLGLLARAARGSPSARAALAELGGNGQARLYGQAVEDEPDDEDKTKFKHALWKMVELWDEGELMKPNGALESIVKDHLGVDNARQFLKQIMSHTETKKKLFGLFKQIVTIVVDNAEIDKVPVRKVLDAALKDLSVPERKDRATSGDLEKEQPAPAKSAPSQDEDSDEERGPEKKNASKKKVAANKKESKQGVQSRKGGGMVKKRVEAFDRCEKEYKSCLELGTDKATKTRCSDQKSKCLKMAADATGEKLKKE